MPINAPKPVDSLATGWATDPDTREEPTSGQKESGWTNGQRPAFNVFNWILGVIFDWLAYFETATDELDDDKIDRDGSVSMAGNFVPDVTETRAVGTALKKFGSGYFQDFAVFGYLELNGQVEMGEVVSDIIPDADGRDLGSAAKRFDAFLQAADIETLDVSGAADFAGFVDMQGDLAVERLFPVSTPLPTNETSHMAAIDVPRVSGHISFDGLGGVTVEAGKNIASVALETDGTDMSELRINFTGELLGGIPIVIAQYAGPTAEGRRSVSELFQQRTASSIVLQVFNHAGVLLPLDGALAADIRIQFVVFHPSITF